MPHFIDRSAAPLSAILLIFAFNFFFDADGAAETIKVHIEPSTVISSIPPDFLG